MSTFVKREIACGGCGLRAERDVATSVNVSRTPEWRARILDETFQRFPCSRCRAVTQVCDAFVYLDFDRRQLIGVLPPAEESHWAEVEHEAADAFERNLGRDGPAVARPIGEGFVVRTVFGLDALREKLILLDAGLDDSIVEVVKLRVLLGMEDRPVVPAGRLRVVDLDQWGMLLVGADGTRTSIPMVDYADVRDDPVLSRELVSTLSSGPYRDLGRILIPAPGPA